ncbi:MFS transporter [Gracilibacillus caseinilyticus]|uniref:MFS transporter n=1 Tax=Gracilibacillus caseinilyticus TaxID=2932256 RepID=A0ABY4EZH7_9BACI|nr:MFS transporter [Gracilibacillus caseinilyticus]UOQ49355.1 MFS transporter [Gracilibacillus caseinilyticus]
MYSKKLIIVGLPMIAVTYGLSRFSYGLMLPYINETMMMEQSTSGVISSLSYIAYCLAIVSAMVFSNKVTPKSVLVIAGLSAIIGLGVISISPNPVVLGTGIFIAGLSTGFSSPPYADIVSTKVETRLQNQTNSWINAGTSIGTAFTGVIAIMMTNSWRETYFIYTCIAILVLFANYKALPKHHTTERENKIGFSKREWRRAVPLILAACLIGISCSAYWTFSKDFMLHAENVPTYIGKWLWGIIGIAGLLGGTAGVFIDKFGLMHAFKLSVLALSTSSLLLGMYPSSPVTGFLSPALFGSSYIFITGVLIVWGISVFNTNPSFGLGLPFLILALGQAIGSIFSGVIADLFGYHTLFVGAGVIGYLSLLLKQKTN